MVVINTKTDKYYSNLSVSKIARLVGVDRTTVHRWLKKKSSKEVYNNYTVYFEPGE